MPITGINTYKEKMSNESQEMIKPIIAYSFVVFISVISILNIFNTILSSIYSRKREIAMLKSMGMSNKGISKMFTLEGIFYGLDSIIYGVLISLVILYIMYMVMIETNIYMFKIPWLNIGISALVMYVVIFMAMSFAKRKIKKQNIIDEIRNENI
ncbi:MAG: FtsX-like permease family protein [Clostridia bacterium]|nr:FtsX-like permease family protein [Clostridia bacterium]